MVKNRDQLYRRPHATVPDFIFDKNVASVFEDMISRSVPGYTQILELLPTLARQFRFANCNYYDLGCSLGAGMVSMAQGLEGINATLIGIDNSDAMLEKATAMMECNTDSLKVNCKLRCADISGVDIENAGMVLMNFTLQFIPIPRRTVLVDTIYNGLVEGGTLVLSEKIAFDDESVNRALTGIHHRFKADQGYSDLEISQKRDAIENVLIPETLDTHIDRLRQAGFRVVTPWLQNLQFVSILAIK